MRKELPLKNADRKSPCPQRRSRPAEPHLRGFVFLLYRGLTAARPGNRIRLISEKPMTRRYGGDAPTESPGGWNPDGKQTARWTAEGADQRLSRVFRDVKAYVSCRGYVSIPQSARLCRETGWHRDEFRPWQNLFLPGFLFSPAGKRRKKT